MNPDSSGFGCDIPCPNGDGLLILTRDTLEELVQGVTVRVETPVLKCPKCGFLAMGSGHTEALQKAARQAYRELKHPGVTRAARMTLLKEAMAALEKFEETLPDEDPLRRTACLLRDRVSLLREGVWAGW